MQIFSGYYLDKFDKFKSKVTGRKVETRSIKQMPFQTKINKVKKSVVLPIAKSVVAVGLAVYLYHLSNQNYIRQLNNRNFNLYAEQKKIYREARWIILRKLVKWHLVGDVAADFYLKRLENLVDRLENPTKSKAKIIKSTQIVDFVLPFTLRFGVTSRTLFYNQHGDLAQILKVMRFSMLSAQTLVKPKPEEIRILKLNNRIEMKHQHLFGKFTTPVNYLDLKGDVNFLLNFSKNVENVSMYIQRARMVEARLERLMLEQPVDQDPFPLTEAEVQAQQLQV